MQIGEFSGCIVVSSISGSWKLYFRRLCILIRPQRTLGVKNMPIAAAKDLNADEDVGFRSAVFSVRFGLWFARTEIIWNNRRNMETLDPGLRLRNPHLAVAPRQEASFYWLVAFV